MNYKVGTRGSKLALRQTEMVIEALRQAYPEDSFELQVIVTTGDRNQTSALDAMGSKGVFVDAIEKALLKDEIQLAVHSMKDMPDTPEDGLIFAKAWKRELPEDVLILRESKSLRELKEGARIGTGSKRRGYQLKKLRPDLEIVPIRGNVDTRIRKLSEVDSEGRTLDGIVLAAAGIHRLGRREEITQYLSAEEMLPAPAQGVLALELNGNNVELLEKLNALSDMETEAAVQLERGFLKKIGGTCHDPIGAYAYCENGIYTLSAMFGSRDGSCMAYAKASGEKPDESLVDQVVCKIREQM